MTRLQRHDFGYQPGGRFRPGIPSYACQGVRPDGTHCPRWEACPHQTRRWRDRGLCLSKEGK